MEEEEKSTKIRNRRLPPVFREEQRDRLSVVGPPDGLCDRRGDIDGVEDLVGALLRAGCLREGVGHHESLYRKGLEGGHRG